MNFPKSQILLIQRHTDKHLLILTQMIESYLSLEEVLQKNIDLFSEHSNRSTLYSPTIQDILHLEHLADICQVNMNARFYRSREIDNTAGIVAGNISMLFDQCIEEYNISLKQWILRKIKDLTELKKKVILHNHSDFFFPSATSILSSYIFKTRLAEDPEKFTVIRNAIRQLIN